MTQIITPTELKELGYVDKNVLDIHCNVGIKLAQEIDLMGLIGENLYNAIIDKIDNDTLTGKYKILVDGYLKDYLWLNAVAEIQTPISNKTRNAGVIKTTDENIESVEDAQVSRMVKYYKSRADSYGKNAMNYIKRNIADFPEFHTEDCNKIKPQDSSFRLNIF